MKLLRSLSILFIFTLLLSCKKEAGVTNPQPTPPSTSTRIKVKREIGQPAGNVKTVAIGASGGTIQSDDGHITITVPAGAVDAATDFSIQPVTNTLQTGALSYRLKPEGVGFKKDVTISYSYAGFNPGTMDSKYLFLAYQDNAGYYHEASLTKNNAVTKTLTVTTRHFSDWTFFYRIELTCDHPLQSGKVYLKKKGVLTLQLHWYHTGWDRDGPQDPYSDTAHEKIMDESWGQGNIDEDNWSISKPLGTIQKTDNIGQAIYGAPETVPQLTELLVTATINGLIGMDNSGQEIHQMILSQPVVLEPDGEFFELTVDGQKQQLHTLTADPEPGLLMFGGYTDNNAAFDIYIYSSGTGSFECGQPGDAGKAGIEYLPVGSDGYIQFRPKDCEGSGEVVFDGNVTISHIANAVGDFTEGSFSATLYKTQWCNSSGTKDVSGHFMIRKNL